MAEAGDDRLLDDQALSPTTWEVREWEWESDDSMYAS